VGHLKVHDAGVPLLDVSVGIPVIFDVVQKLDMMKPADHSRCNATGC
jgi:hypothetical protein